MGLRLALDDTFANDLPLLVDAPCRFQSPSWVILDTIGEIEWLWPIRRPIESALPL